MRNPNRVRGHRKAQALAPAGTQHPETNPGECVFPQEEDPQSVSPGPASSCLSGPHANLLGKVYSLGNSYPVSLGITHASELAAGK